LVIANEAPSLIQRPDGGFMTQMPALRPDDTRSKF